MAFSNFIETFFFISLGITFILILLLVYHFKDRLNSIEKKSDTMFDIVNNVVKEMILMRSSQSNTVEQGCGILNKCQINTPFRKEIVLPPFETISKIDVSIDGDEEDDEDDEEDDDEDDEDEDEDDEEEDEDEDGGMDLIEFINHDKDEYADDEEIKHINVIKINEIDEEIKEDEYISINTFDIIDIPILTRQQNTPIEINEIVVQEEEIETEKENQVEDYKKMNTQSLKNLVISKGLFNGQLNGQSRDISKLKKWELIKLLEGSV